MAEISIVEIRQGPVGPAGSPANVTQVNMEAAITNAEAFRETIGLESSLQLPYLASRLASSGLINPRILVLGDSVAEGKLYSLRDALIAQFGELQARAYFEHGGAVASGASAVTGGFAYWPTGDYFSVPTSGTVTFLANTVSQLRCNQAKVYYIKESGGGSFKVQSSYNGGAYADVTGTISASNASTIGAVETITLPLGLNSIRVVGVSGTVKIFPICRYSSTGKVGAALYSITKGGLSMADAVTCPAAILAPIIQDLAPDVVIFEAKEGSGVLESNFATLYGNINTAAGYVPDWVLLGTNQTTGSATDRLAQTEFLRAHADTEGQAFLDLGLLFGPDITAAEDRGLQSPAGDVHPTSAGYAAQTAAIMQAIGPALRGSINSQSRPSTIVESATLLTTATGWRASVLNSGFVRNTPPALGAFTNIAAGSRSDAAASMGVARLVLYGATQSGDYARVAVSQNINSGLGTGSGTRYNVPIGFAVRLARVVRTGHVLRIFIGSAGTDQLAAAGIGIQINSDDTAQLIAHNGSTLVTGTAFAIATFTGELEFIVESDAAGNVFCYYASAGSVMPRNPISTLSGAPTGTAADPYHTLCASVSSSATATVGTTEARILDALVFQGLSLIP